MRISLSIFAAVALFLAGFFVARLAPSSVIAIQPEYTNSVATELIIQTSAAIIGYGTAKIEDLEILRAANFDGIAAQPKMGTTDEGINQISNKTAQFFWEMRKTQHATSK